MSRTKVTFAVCAIGSGLLIILAAVFGLRAYAHGNLAQARRIASQLQADAIANPNPVVAGPPTTAGAHHGGGRSAATAASSSTRGAVPSTVAAARLGAPGPSTTAASTTATSSAPRTSTSATAKAPATNGTRTATAPTAPVTAPRTEPTAGEVQQAITAVHTLVPFYSPSAADIAAAGNDVCTAFDNGDSLAQVQTAALSMIGAASFSSYIPAADTDVAIQTLVALYCPGYASRVG